MQQNKWEGLHGGSAPGGGHIAGLCSKAEGEAQDSIGFDESQHSMLSSMEKLNGDGAFCDSPEKARLQEKERRLQLVNRSQDSDATTMKSLSNYPLSVEQMDERDLECMRERVTEKRAVRVGKARRSQTKAKILK